MSASSRDRAESIRHRLRNRVREHGEDAQFALQRYAQERFLYRLGESSFRERFILKGAMLFALWGGSVYRPTRDLDFTGYGSSDEQEILATLRRICEMPGVADEVVFDVATLTAEPIRDEEEYRGLRIRLQATLGESRIPMQIDIGFGNAIEPPALDVQYPTLLNDRPPRIRAYPQEAVIAEKLHAMVVLGERTSRFKDFYDLYVLACQFSFEGSRLTRAIAATFERRNTAIDAAQPAALAPRFFADAARAQQWRTYLDRNRLPGAPADLGAVGELLRSFLGPPWSELVEKKTFGATWQAGGPWGPELEALTLPITATLLPQVFRADQKPGAPGALGGAGGTMRGEGGTSLRRFKPYPAYKDSGVEWLGAIPAHWRWQKLRHACRKVTDGSHHSPPTVIDGQPYVTVRDLVDGRVDVDNAARISEDSFRLLERNGCRPHIGDVLFSKDGSIGKVALVERDDFVVLSSLAILRSGPSSESSFLAYFLGSAPGVSQIESRFAGAALRRITLDVIVDLVISIPQKEEQLDIATFLDRETARIDALVAKKERLIELLHEKRTALITRAVTKGLYPNVPMKDSGVEWLGEIPAHWEFSALKRRARRVQTGSTPPTAESRYYEDGVVAWYGPGSFTDDLPLQEPTKLISESAVREGVARVFEAGSSAIVTIGATIGKVAFMENSGSCNQQITMVTFDPHRVYPRYGAYQLKRLEPVLRGIAPNTTLPILDQEEVGYLPFAAPPISEQSAVVALLDQETTRIDALAGRIRDAIDRLRELRTALISAAVTGKIDVREEAA